MASSDYHTNHHIKGVELAERFYYECVAPLLNKHFASILHTSCLIGHGSEVLGYDTAMSEDHDFGPRCMIFLSEVDHVLYANEMTQLLKQELPKKFLGFSTHFGSPDNIGVRLLESIDDDDHTALVEHRVEFKTLKQYFQKYVGIDIDEPSMCVCISINHLIY
jgi:hypothetical protein